MNVLVVLLRAINVGGRNKIPMADLRELLAELEFANIATYIQSGNVVCSSDKEPGVAAMEIKRDYRAHGETGQPCSGSKQ